MLQPLPVPAHTRLNVPAMSLLIIRDLTIRMAGRLLMDNAALVIDPGRRVGLVGRNGAGKSTLLKAISGELQPDGGEIRIARNVRVGQVRQEMPDGPETLLEIVLTGDQERLALLAEAETAPPERLAEVHDRLVTISADSAPARAATILAGLGFDAAAQLRPISSFSGGWRMRVALATVLFAAPELLLLDEPTNHLDLEATLWLETWLSRFQGAAIVVSHDRGLLDRCVDSIAHLDQGKIHVTPGGYEEFIRIRTERAAQQAANAVKIAAQKAHMQAFVDRWRYKASKARQAQSRMKAIAKLPPVEAALDQTTTRFNFPEPTDIAPPMLSLDRVTLGYGDTVVLRDVSLRIDMEDRIALLGANGNGKSTLAKLLAGRMEPMTGEVRRGPKLRVGYFAQHQTDELILTETPIDHMQRALPNAPVQQVRSQLARFGLDVDRANTKTGSLSGGEKARLLLALATRDAPQLLILDEPTNHLDIDAREALVRALADFGGAVLLITHDPDLVNLVADNLWLVADGTAKPFVGDLDDYRVVLAERARGPAKPVDAAKALRNDRRGRAEARAQLAPLKKRVADAEKRMATLASERVKIEREMANPAIYQPSRKSEALAIQTRLTAIKRLEAVAEADWLVAAEALENADMERAA